MAVHSPRHPPPSASMLTRGTASVRDYLLRSGAFLSLVWWLVCVIALLAAQSSAVELSWFATSALLASLAMGAATGLLFAYDKHQAQAAAWRVREITLLICTLAGGWSGSFLAQRWLRHKSQQWRFQAAAWLGFVIHVGAMIIWWWWG